MNACWLASSLALLAACGDASPQAKSPVQPAGDGSPQAAPLREEKVDSARKDERQVGQLDALERDLAIAEERMDEQLRAKVEAGKSDVDEPRPAGEQPVTPGAQPPPAGWPPPDRPRPPMKAPRANGADAEARYAGSGSRCDIACRAYHSMRRAADTMCDLTGSDDEQCRSARSRVDRAARRIADAGCQCLP